MGDELRGTAWSDFSLEEAPRLLGSLPECSDSSWLSSAGFATLFEMESATRVLVSPASGGAAGAYVFYREATDLSCLKTLHVFGPVTLTPDDIQQLMTRRRAHCVSISNLPDNHAQLIASESRHSTVHRTKEDFVIPLPGSVPAYLAQLGRNARKHIPYYERRISREFGSEVHYEYAAGADITSELFTDLVGLNRTRIERKGDTHLWDAQLVDRRWKLARTCGLMCGVYAGDRLVGGTLSYLYQNHAYLVLIGHDPAFDNLNLGNVCLWMTIKRLVDLKVDSFHLLWGRSFYKTQFGGEEIDLYDVRIFRDAVSLAVVSAVLQLRWVGAQPRRVVRRCCRISSRIRRRLIARRDMARRAD